MRASSVVEPAKRAIDALAQSSIAPYGGSCKARGADVRSSPPGLRPRLLSCARCAGFADNSAMLLQSRFVSSFGFRVCSTDIGAWDLGFIGSWPRPSARRARNTARHNRSVKPPQKRAKIVRSSAEIKGVRNAGGAIPRGGSPGVRARTPDCTDQDKR